MWEVKNRTPFQAAGAFDRDKEGLESWCVAVRATFDVSMAGAVSIAADQPGVRLAPAYYDADNSELLGEQDIVAFATGTDVLVRGTVKVPPSEKLQIPLRLTVGSVKKTARLFGPRQAKRGVLGWRIVTQSPVGDTELRWHNSFGGTMTQPQDMSHPANPLGQGIGLLPAARSPRGTLVTLPPIEAADAGILDNPEDAMPTGFGPVARHWQSRLKLAGTYDQAWQDSRAPRLPHDFDPGFYNSAPPDQCVAGFLRGGETMTLEGFFPEGPLSLRLPQIILTGQTLLRHRPIETRFDLLRVEVDLDIRQIQMVWTTTVSCNGDDAGLQVTTVRIKQMSGITS